MRPPLSDNKACDDLTTSEASLPLASVHPGLVHSTVYHSIPKIGSELFDRFLKCSLDSLVEFYDSLLIKFVSRCLRVNSNFPERLIDIDVTEASKNALVKQHGLNFTRSLDEDLL